ncbi:MAG: DoxX family protein [SAR86 cluster bacterium]|jgi:uncharacterized membrane protein YphA (DoxX/SURF4 family)|nr:DoxX family protein [SAR86 cluster bacterium]
MNSFLSKMANPFIDIAHWLLRLSLGISFFIHGWGKLPLPPKRLSGGFESMGLPAPEILSSLVSLGEMGAGIGIILGGLFKGNTGNIATRLSGGAIAIIMIGAIILVHLDWISSGKIFTTEQIFLLVLGIYFAIKGNNN